MAEEMWKKVKSNMTTKSTLFMLDAEDQLTSMKLLDNEDSKTHLSELKFHFQANAVIISSKWDQLFWMLGSTLY